MINTLPLNIFFFSAKFNFYELCVEFLYIFVRPKQFCSIDSKNNLKYLQIVKNWPEYFKHLSMPKKV